jgi:CBS domain-containing protein
MRVNEVMTRDVRISRPDQTIQDAAWQMLEIDAGALPVGENDRLIGMITDRDIAVRGIARGKGPQTPVREVMTSDVKFCFEDEETDHIVRNMGDQQIRRLPVLNRNKRLVGLLSVGDLAIAEGSELAGEAVADISRPGGAHSQSG